MLRQSLIILSFIILNFHPLLAIADSFDSFALECNASSSFYFKVDGSQVNVDIEVNNVETDSSHLWLLISRPRAALHNAPDGLLTRKGEDKRVEAEVKQLVRTKIPDKSERTVLHKKMTNDDYTYNQANGADAALINNIWKRFFGRDLIDGILESAKKHRLEVLNNNKHDYVYDHRFYYIPKYSDSFTYTAKRDIAVYGTFYAYLFTADGDCISQGQFKIDGSKPPRGSR
jgi:hypothetical protein